MSNIYGEKQQMQISVCTYQGGDWEVIIVDKKTGEEVLFSGHGNLSDTDFEIVNRLAPACVWTTYEEVVKT